MKKEKTYVVVYEFVDNSQMRIDTISVFDDKHSAHLCKRTMDIYLGGKKDLGVCVLDEEGMLQAIKKFGDPQTHIEM